MNFIENRLFDEINVGDCAALERTLTEQDITLFAVMSGDINPAHVDPEYAMGSRFREVIGHGMWSGALISTVLGTEFPGPGTIYLGQNLRFRRPVKVGDTITVKVTAREKDAEKGKVILDTECVNQDGEVVVLGTAEVIAPKEKIRLPEDPPPRGPSRRQGAALSLHHGARQGPQACTCRHGDRLSGRRRIACRHCCGGGAGRHSPDSRSAPSVQFEKLRRLVALISGPSRSRRPRARRKPSPLPSVWHVTARLRGS